MEKKNNWLNIPNFLSLLRLLTIPPIVILIILSTHRNYVFLLVLYFISFMLDFFDGYLARKLSQETELGKILDPIADKLMIFGVLAALLIKTDFPIWMAILIVARDLVILSGSFILLRGKRKVAPSVLLGKTAFAILGVLMMVYIVDLPETFDLGVLKRFFTTLSVSFLAWSFLEYYFVYKKKEKENAY